MHRRTMPRRSLLALAGTSGTAALAGCLSSLRRGDDGTRTATPTGNPEMGTPPDIDAPIDGFVAGNTNFGLALNGLLANDAPNENRFLSPYSIGVTLAMTYAGARGQTKTEMAEALQFAPDGEGLHPAVASLRSSLPLGRPTGTPTPSPTPPEETPVGEPQGVPFRLLGANALWGQTGFPFREAYLTLLDEYYGTGMGEVDFESKPEAARERINGWVDNRTRGKVPELFSEGAIGQATRLVLANAVYFEANWADTFDEEDTEQRAFTALDGSTEQVPVMAQQDHFPYAAVDGHQVVTLPYAGGNTDMVVLLPAEGEFREFERSLDAARLAELLEATEKQEGTVGLPRFSARSKLKLPDYLEELGMERAFSSAADFSGMASGSAGEKLALDDVLHEATITVDENGTEAAAATGVEVVMVSKPLNPFEMVCDRPFIYMIRHRPTGAPLFLGRLVDAAAAQP